MPGLSRAVLLASAASGCAALIFEVLLFRRLELLLGRSVEASALVMAAYMLGLAIGGLLAQKRVAQIHARQGFIAAEIWIGIIGVALVLLTPMLAAISADWPAAVARLCMLGLLLLPTIAMGWSMPVLAQALLRGAGDYQQHFSGLYAANTLGASVGALGSVLLLRNFGVADTAMLALLCNVISACLVMAVIPADRAAPPKSTTTAMRLSLRAWLLMAAAFLSGALLLGLEVVWLRALLLKLRGTDWQFASVLAVVIAGLAVGAVLSRHAALAVWAAAAALGGLVGYGLFGFFPEASLLERWSASAPLLAALVLAGPVSLCSGALFTALATALRGSQASSAVTTGRLYAANALGAALGSLAAMYLLLPHLGLAHSWLLLIGLYAGLAAVLAMLPRDSRASVETKKSDFARGLMVIASAIFAGLFVAKLPNPSALWFDLAVQQYQGYALVERRESVDASLQLAQRSLAGEPVAYRLITDGYSMSGTEADSLRYMRQFSQLPQALHANPASALLISYGVGTTARALLADSALQSLDVVDTSADTLAFSAVVHGEADPLGDPRVRVHIDDGRQFLLRAGRDSYDIISAEPPPPRLAGVVNLYTREYFDLTYRALNPHGLISHWLPVDQLSWPSVQATVRAFCEVYADCSLWAGSHYNWLLMGSRDGIAALSDTQLQRLWNTPSSKQLLDDAGFERSSLMATSFLADARQLSHWVGQGPALEDDYPGRLQSREITDAELQRYFLWMDDRESQQRFAKSEWVQRVWPQAIREQAMRDWIWQPILNGQVQLPPEEMAQVSVLAVQQGLRQPLLRLANISGAELLVGVGIQNPSSNWYRGWWAFLQSDWPAAQQHWQSAEHPAALAMTQVARCFAAGDC